MQVLASLLSLQPRWPLPGPTFDDTEYPHAFESARQPQQVDRGPRGTPTPLEISVEYQQAIPVRRL